MLQIIQSCIGDMPEQARSNLMQMKLEQTSQFFHELADLFTNPTIIDASIKQYTASILSSSIDEKMSIKMRIIHKGRFFWEALSNPSRSTIHHQMINFF